jgi:hypothetical protein
MLSHIIIIPIFDIEHPPKYKCEIGEDVDFKKLAIEATLLSASAKLLFEKSKALSIN